jgi:hypothetical protein
MPKGGKTAFIGVHQWLRFQLMGGQRFCRRRKKALE